MAKFDIHEWRQSHLYQDPYQETIETLAEVFIKAKYPNILYENVSPQLKEGIIDTIKDKFDTLSTKLKDTAQKAIKDIGKSDFLNLFDIFKNYKPKSPNKLIQLIAIANSDIDFSSIKEETIEFIKSQDEINKLPHNTTFMWDKEDDPDFKYNPPENQPWGPTSEFGEGEGKGLKKGEIYVILPPITDDYPQYMMTLNSVKSTERDLKGGGGGLAALRKFMEKHPVGKGIKFLMLGLGLFSVGQGLAADTNHAVADILGQDAEIIDVYNDLGAQNVFPVDDLPDSETSDSYDAEDNDMLKGTNAATTNVDATFDDLSSFGVDLGEANDWEDSAAYEIITHDTGEYEAGQEAINDSASSATEKLVDQINNSFGEGDQVERITIDINYGGAASFQGDNDSNNANDGTNLIDGRTATSLEMANAVQTQVLEILTSQWGQDFVDSNLEINVLEIDTEPGLEKQKVEDAGGNTQASFITVDLDVETGDKGKPVSFLKYIFAYTKRNEILGCIDQNALNYNSEATEDDGTCEYPEIKPDDTVIPPPNNPKEYLDIASGIRESQFAMIFQLIKPDIPLFSYLNQMLGKENKNKFLDTVLYSQKDYQKLRDYEKSTEADTWNDATDEEIGGNVYYGDKRKERMLEPPKGGWPPILNIPQEVKSLAGVFINLRKSPDKFIKKVGNVLNIEFETRHPAKHYVAGAQKGQGRAVAGQSLQEIHPFNDLLYEAAVDEFIDESNIKKHAAQILMMLGSMYARKEDIALSILNPEKLSDDIKKNITILGFKPITTGMEAGQYVFLGDGDYSLQTGDKPSSDTGDKPSTDSTIDPRIEKAYKEGKIFSTKKNEKFPKGIEKTQFYKDAVQEGWVFIHREDLPKGAKFITLPSVDLEKIKTQNFKDLIKKDKIKPAEKNTGDSLPSVNFSQYQSFSPSFGSRFEENIKIMKKQKLQEVKKQVSSLIIKQKNKKLQEAKYYLSQLINEEDQTYVKMDVKTVTGLADVMLDLSKRIRKGEFKGLDAAEINEIDDMVTMLLQAAKDSNVTAVVKRLEAMFGKSAGLDIAKAGSEKADEEEAEFEPETKNEPS